MCIRDRNKGLSHANFPIAYNYNGASHFTSSLEHTLIEEFSHLGLPASQSVVNYTGRNIILDSMFGFSRFMMGGDENKVFADIRGLYQKEGTLKNFAVYQKDVYKRQTRISRYGRIALGLPPR